jgi:ubiquinone/menaquinone biosynthesis C-methylase UbiE
MTWKFDSEVASMFVDHARKHIPNYDLTIDKTVDICRYLLKNNSTIIDVGSATGETLQRLYDSGFTNLFGIDCSLDMIKKSNPLIATYIHSNNFPTMKFDAVIINWTLHFIKHKKEYLQEVYKSLSDNGIVILTDKTSQDPIPLHFYHQLKSQNGVSDIDIAKKANSIKDIMFINNVEWYLQTLNNLGFCKVYVIDADWCFTSFLCVK